ncbi:MAG TPA: TraR/DksA C4-type zinc finger protein [Egibacteraceae bacterium]|nr:TraR/DksA C4-type zinc finger protein [Egibacteraceae bacterium]
MAELTDEQRQQLRRHIAAERRRAEGRVAALQREFDNIVDASAESVRDDEHDPEGATIAFERAQVAALLAAARVQQVALTQAAERLEGPDAGRCTRCAATIGFERLLARPSTSRCVACAAA